MPTDRVCEECAFFAVIATWSSVRPGIASPSAQLCVQFLSITRYLLNRASAPRVRTSSPRSTGLDIRCTSTTAAKAFAVGLMRIGLERLDLDAKNTKADDAASLIDSHQRRVWKTPVGVSNAAIFVSEASSRDPFVFSTLRQPRCMEWMALVGLMATL